MRRFKQEQIGDQRQTWCFDGRRIVEGQDCYVWKRYLAEPTPITGFHTLAYAHPVTTFWPS